jgi:Type I 3-dehydroquinase
VQQERRGLSRELKSLKDISSEHDNANTESKKQPSTIAVVHDDDRVMDLFCTVLGQPKAFATAFAVDSVISVPRLQALSGHMRWSSADVTRVYHAAREYGDIVKIIGFANTLAENYELEYFRSSMTTSYGIPLLAINAGTMGQSSRVLNKFFTPTTHPLPMAAAPGQLSGAEIYCALHIVGQLPSRTYFSIGKQDASPLTGFFQKFFNELGLRHRHSTFDNPPEDILAALARGYGCCCLANEGDY